MKVKKSFIVAIKFYKKFFIYIKMLSPSYYIKLKTSKQVTQNTSTLEKTFFAAVTFEGL